MFGHRWQELGAVALVLVASYVTVPEPRRQRRRSDAEEGASCAALRATRQEEDSPRLVAIGDIHGDAVALREVLQKAGVASADCEWRATGPTVVVQMGDVVDRGPESEEANACLERLQRGAAAAAGSRVVRLTGNHELLQAEGDLRFAARSDTPATVAAAVTKWLGDVRQGRVQGAFAFGPFLFTHAGFRPAMLAKVVPEPQRATASDLAVVLAGYVNEKLTVAVERCSSGTSPCASFRGDDVFSAGPDRGGRGLGGPFWTDFSVLTAPDSLPGNGLIQVVGHSAARCDAKRSATCEPIRARPDLAAIVVDAGLSEAYAANRAFLDVRHDNGLLKVLATTLGPHGTWRDTDLSHLSCPSLRQDRASS